MSLRIRFATAAVAGAAVPLLVSCGSDGGGESAEPTTAGPVPTESSGPSEITLAFAGDVHFPAVDEGVPNRTAALLEDPATAYGPMAEVFAEADYSVVNLETPVTGATDAEAKLWTFKAPEEAMEATAAANVDLVSLANNHGLDYKEEGLLDTLDYAEEHGVDTVGAGRDAEEAYAPLVADVEGVEIAFLGLNQVWDLWESWEAGDDSPGMAYVQNLDRATEAVRSASERADVVIVYMHWGQEGNECPIPEMRDAARALADAGADALLGTHAHLLLSDGWLDDTYVHYGLGNFLWWRDDSFSNDTGVLRLHLTGPEVTGVEFVPALISRETGQPIPVEGAEAERILGERERLRGCTGLAPEPPA
ncbi:CapA family protein [Salininema proteolyticum]|uniref:CapA family protein n=1 Tax=Salininema proteolyticum TaxID=1607685 RepID=A0ABV8U1P2_9ACTN